MDYFAFLISFLQTSAKYCELEQQYCNSIPDHANLRKFLEQKDEVSLFFAIYTIQELNKSISSEFLLYLLCLRNIIDGLEQISNNFLTKDEVEIVIS